MIERQRLPSRSEHEVVEFEHGGIHYTAGAGRFEDGRLAEIFLILVFHVPNGSHRKPVEPAILKGLGVRAGVPDVIAVKDGRTYALEIKRLGGRLTAAQNAAHAALRAAGATVVTSYSLDEAIAQLERWGLLRGPASMPANRVWEQRRQ
jgi:hypothetical protein